MKNKTFLTPFQSSTRSINTATVLYAAGFFVQVLRQAATRRAIFYFDDSPATRELVEQYESGQLLPIPTKKLLEGRMELAQRCAAAVREAA